MAGQRGAVWAVTIQPCLTQASVLWFAARLPWKPCEHLRGSLMPRPAPLALALLSPAIEAWFPDAWVCPTTTRQLGSSGAWVLLAGGLWCWRTPVGMGGPGWLQTHFGSFPYLELALTIPAAAQGDESVRPGSDCAPDQFHTAAQCL